MLNLKNIKRKGNSIEAYYTPEDSNKLGYVKLDCDTFEEEHKTVDGYETTYPTMAIYGLKQILNKEKNDENYTIPNEKLVMWY